MNVSFSEAMISYWPKCPRIFAYRWIVNRSRSLTRSGDAYKLTISQLSSMDYEWSWQKFLCTWYTLEKQLACQLLILAPLSIKYRGLYQRWTMDAAMRRENLEIYEHHILKFLNSETLQFRKSRITWKSQNFTNWKFRKFRNIISERENSAMQKC